MEKGLLGNIFAITATIFLIVATYTYAQVFIVRDYVIFTTDEEIEEVQSEKFGTFADYL